MHRLLRSALPAALFTALALPALADDRPQTTRDALGGGQDRMIEGRMPEWSIKEDVRQIEKRMGTFTQLSDSLGAASAELAQDFERYLDDPNNELLASTIEKKMAIFADQVVQDFDRVIADQDLIVSNFKDLRRKLGHFDGTLLDKLDSYDNRLQRMRDTVDDEEQTLIGLAIQIKEAREDRAKRQLQSEFAREYRRFRLRNRNLRGLERNVHNYQVLVQNLQMMTNLFTQLQDKFVALIENLEAERTYLLEAVELQQDSVKIKKIMNEGILHGERSIKNVTEKLAQLYLRVDAFTEVHDRINMGLGRFGETQETLTALSSRIDAIGEGVFGGSDPSSIEEAVEHFAGKRGELRRTPERRFDDD